MNFDESQLSAFLDEELDPDDQTLVAWNVESSSAIAQRLADLKEARSAVAGLERPTIPVDLSAAVLADIAQWQKRQRRRTLAGAGRLVASVVGIGSLAASLLFALFLLYQPLHDNKTSRLFAFGGPAEPRNHPPRSLPRPREIVALTPPGRSTLPEQLGEPSVDRAPAQPSSVVNDLKMIDPIVQVTEPVDGPDPARPGQVDAMLGHRKVWRALIVTDLLDQTARRVRSLIEQDSAREPEFGQITLTRGIVVDPDQPGEAEVYSVVMNESSSEAFLAQLEREFRDVQIDAEPDPATITHLSEVGQVAVFSGVRPALLGSIPAEVKTLVAAKGAPTGDHIRLPAPGPFDPGGFQSDSLDDARVARNLSGTDLILRKMTTPAAPLGSQQGQQVEKPGKPVAAAEPVTVLVWVTRPSPQ